MRWFRSPPLSENLKVCLGLSRELAAPQQATPITLLLSILEAGAHTTAQRELISLGLNKYGSDGQEQLRRAFEQLDEEERARAPARLVAARPGGWLSKLVPGLAYNDDADSVLRRATEICINTRQETETYISTRQKKVSTDDLFLALIIEDGPAKKVLVEFGMDPSSTRNRMMQIRTRSNIPDLD
jgi:hypothetical protein